ncbi:MAG: TIM barrel protein [Candidatus Limnocylindria bacterium]
MEIAGIAAAPVSFGVFGDAGDDPAWGREAEAMLRAIGSAGFTGIELGPPRYFGPPELIRERLARYGLRSVGAYIPLHLGDPQYRDADLRSMRLTLEELAAGGRGLAILADWGTERLLANPGRAWDDRTLALDTRAWTIAAETLRRAVELAAEFDAHATFHPHIATYVESRWEIERLLETVDISLTIDTGHVFLAGSSPTEILENWPTRVNHIHLKDVKQAVLREAKAHGRADLEAWWPNVSCPLGDGDVDLDQFIDGLRGIGYRGWLVVEQDRARAHAEEFEPIARDQARNEIWVRSRLRHGELAPAGAVAGRATDRAPRA